ETDDATNIMDPVFWRFYLLYSRPEKKDVEFSWKELDKTVNNIFIDNVSNFINRVTSFAFSKFDGSIPGAEVEGEVRKEVKDTVVRVEDMFEAGSLSGGLREICELGNYGNRYFQKKKPWDTGDVNVVLSSLYAAKAIAIMLNPFVPSFSRDVYRIFGISDPSWDSIYQVPEGEINEPEPLLIKQDIDEIKGEYEEITKKRAKKTEEETGMSSQKVSFDDFSAMDIRVGKVAEVEKMPSADRLYKLEVDVGEKKLQTISGLKKHYSAAELQDKRVIVLTNLEPAKIHGEKSECMLLAAEGDSLSLLTTDKEVEPGANIA
ncbi:methionine--tRNA ligase subunit beta, partial [Candidatus Bipolaricaulota bacterium]|nr:methionine--tRNA ligase subunit beta [Candidatus Bipolaricaulota bacterium]